MKKIVILISGRGSNLEAILQANILKAGEAQIVQVICNRPEALGIDIAKKYQIPVTIIDHTSFLARNLYDEALLEITRRPGAQVMADVKCGKRSVAFVCFYEVIEWIRANVFF
jgi:folate-dependent phosphoribosylglycinamide formyltransferase PurN